MEVDLDGFYLYDFHFAYDQILIANDEYNVTFMICKLLDKNKNADLYKINIWAWQKSREIHT